MKKFFLYAVLLVVFIAVLFTTDMKLTGDIFGIQSLGMTFNVNEYGNMSLKAGRLILWAFCPETAACHFL